MINNESVLVLIAAITNFILGGIWYSVLREKWLKAWNKKPNEINQKDPKPYLIALIGSCWASYGMFLILKHIQPKSTQEILAVALGTWLFVYVGMGAKHYAFARVKFAAFAIDYGVDLLGFILMAFIIWS